MFLGDYGSLRDKESCFWILSADVWNVFGSWTGVCTKAVSTVICEPTNSNQKYSQRRRFFVAKLAQSEQNCIATLGNVDPRIVIWFWKRFWKKRGGQKMILGMFWIKCWREICIFGCKCTNLVWEYYSKDICSVLYKSQNFKLNDDFGDVWSQNGR